MSDLISRQSVINAVANTCFWLSADNWEELTKCINSIPFAENRPKGEWDINCQGIVFCSHCKKVFNHNYDIDYMESHFKYCPNCGAVMRGE